MVLPGIVLRNLIFYRQKTLPALLLCGLLLLLPAASWLLVRQITSLADRPLAALDTELILQQEAASGKDAATVRTRGLVEPFNLEHFDREAAAGHLAGIKGIARFSTALVLWRFDPQNTLTVVGLDSADPPVGLRKIESLLFKGRFFSSGQADEVILERHFAKLFGHKPGGSFTLAGRKLAIVGLVDFTEQSNLTNATVFLPGETARALAGLEERVSNQLFISLVGAHDLDGISEELAHAFPGFALISRDSLYKNLSSFNRLIYRGGHLFVLLVLPLSLLLLSWVLKMHRLEFAGQIEILKTLGWPTGALRRWQLLDLGYLLAGGLLLAGVLSGLLHFLALTHLRIAPLLDQGFSL